MYSRRAKTRLMEFCAARPTPSMVSRPATACWLLVSVLSSVVLGQTLPGGLVTHTHLNASSPRLLAADKAALLDFRTGFTNDASIFDQWVPNSDPCHDNWRGVLCDCSFNGTYDSDPKARWG